MNNELKFRALMEQVKFLKPIKYEENRKTISVVFSGDQRRHVGYLQRIMQEHGFNYPDPRPGTIDAEAKIVNPNGKHFDTLMVFKKLTRSGYDAILDTAVDTDGDGKLELPPVDEE